MTLQTRTAKPREKTRWSKMAMTGSRRPSYRATRRDARFKNTNFYFLFSFYFYF
uniref:Uncharacterized protein n=1 Tax=Anguilla anguilla TaxID=7936 RepID=A0A0E9T8A0_ANGAN